MGDIVELDTTTPRKLGETVYSDRGLRLAPLARMRAENWPWYVLIASPFVGLVIAALWHSLS